MTDAPLVSVVIPAYNAERTIGAAIESALLQRYPRVEVIVVDDGSTDATPAELARFGNRIRVVRQVNAGLAAARNVGHSAASGTFVAWLDADDLMLPDRIALQVELLLRSPSIVLVSAEFTAFTDDGAEFPRFAESYYPRIARAGGHHSLYGERMTLTPRAGWCDEPWAPVECLVGDISREIEWGNVVHPPTVMFRRELLGLVGDLDLEGGPAADWEFFIRASRAGPFGLIDVPLLRYRVHPGQMSGKANLKRHLLSELYVYRKTHKGGPQLEPASRQKWRLAHAKLYADLARVELEQNRLAAVSWLGLAMSHRPPLKVVLVLLALLVMPTALWALALRLRRSLRPAGPMHVMMVAGIAQQPFLLPLEEGASILIAAL